MFRPKLGSRGGDSTHFGVFGYPWRYYSGLKVARRDELRARKAELPP